MGGWVGGWMGERGEVYVPPWCTLRRRRTLWGWVGGWVGGWVDFPPPCTHLAHQITTEREKVLIQFAEKGRNNRWVGGRVGGWVGGWVTVFVGGHHHIIRLVVAQRTDHRQGPGHVVPRVDFVVVKDELPPTIQLGVGGSLFHHLYLFVMGG